VGWEGAEPTIAVAPASPARSCKRAGWCSFPNASMAMAMGMGEAAAIADLVSATSPQTVKSIHIPYVQRGGSFVPLRGKG
jgi:hypothetical protein